MWRYQRGNQNPYIEEEQKTKLSKVPKDKQRSTKHTHKTKDWVTRNPLKPGVNSSKKEQIIKENIDKQSNTNDNKLSFYAFGLRGQTQRDRYIIYYLIFQSFNFERTSWSYYCAVCPSSMYGFWLLLWHLQTFHILVYVFIAFSHKFNN